MTNGEAIPHLRRAWTERRLTLYLGAGVSVGNGLPTWERLVLAMYFDLISREHLGGWRPFSNYLYAIAEWHLRRTREPLEVTARRLRGWYEAPGDFLKHLKATLYGGLQSEETPGLELPPPDAICSANSTLDAVARLCRESTHARGVSAVISYNYDNLVEHALALDGASAGQGNAPRFRPVWNETPLAPDVRPIYHVHGYVPANGAGSSEDEIVFTEDQYNLAAADPYSWASLVQLNNFSGNVGCMIGLSIADRNMRRLLDAVMRTPGRAVNFALLKRPSWPRPTDEQVDEIDGKARQYLDRFSRSGVKSRAMLEGGAGYVPAGIKAREPGAGMKGPTYAVQIRSILEAVESIDIEQQTSVLRQLGVHPIWYDDHGEIPEILGRVTARSDA